MKESKLKRKLLDNIGLTLALSSAFLYAFTVIIEKNYIKQIDAGNILFLMYLGAGLGLFIVHSITKGKRKEKEEKITKKEIPKIIAIVLCELVASYLLIEALKTNSASLVSLLSIFEIVMTSVIAYLFFNDPMYKSELIAIILVLIGNFILNFTGNVFEGINLTSAYVVLACLAWGLENNIIASISTKEPTLFTAIKCLSVSIMYLLIILLKGAVIHFNPLLIIYGFFTYGLGILFYAISTKYLNASKATLGFSFCPLFGVALSVLIFKDNITITFIISAILMTLGIIYMNKENK